MSHSIANLPDVVTLIELALSEDLGRGDVTTLSVIGQHDKSVRARLVARQSLVVYGAEIARAVFLRVDASLEVTMGLPDGSNAESADPVLTVTGSAGSILKAERTALNFIQRLSGIATMSRQFATSVAGTSARVVDTRKTTPGYRVLEKAAVRVGGCFNHRADLGSGILIKDNHIVACGSVTIAVERAKKQAPHPLRIEVEVENESELDEAIAAKADIVLLDNMSPDQLRQAVTLRNDAGVATELEASGGVNLATVASIAQTGVERISVGALTHSATALDVALDWIA